MRARGRDRERGASLVEFALVVPLLTLFLFGIVQFGLAYDAKQSINSAAREGARTGALPGSTVANIRTATQNAYQGLLDDAAVNVNVSHDGGGGDPPCATAGNVIVVASVNFDLTIPFWGVEPLKLEGRGEFRCETP